MMTRLKTSFRSYLRDESGVLLAEFLILIPMVIWAFLALFVYWDVFKTINITQKAAYSISDLLSRQIVVNEDFLDGQQEILDFLTPNVPESRIRITSMEMDEGTDVQAAWDGDDEFVLLFSHSPGDKVTLEIAKSAADTTRSEITVTLGQNPDQADKALLGVRYRAATDVRMHLDEMMPSVPTDPDAPNTPVPGQGLLPFLRGQSPFSTAEVETGALVQSVTTESPAESAGLKPGDVITELDGEAGITSKRLWAIVKRFFGTAAGVLADTSPALAEKLQLASPHWMRHTHATHALQRGAELTTVRDNLRHASLSTTSMYLHSDDLRRAKQIGGAFEAPAA